MNDRQTCLVLVATMALLSATCSQSADWPTWRGPQANGISAEKEWNEKGLAYGAKVLWKAEVGEGYAAVTIKGDRLFTMGNKDNTDYVYCLNVEDGKEVWSHSYPCKKGGYPGPRATPIIDGGMIYGMSREGRLFCLEAKSGAVKWLVNIQSEFGAKPPHWGFASTPVIEGDLLIVNAGSAGLAFNKKTGEKVWGDGAGACSYATPVIFTFGGKKCAAVFSGEALHCLDLANGEKLWSFQWKTKYNINAADPVPFGDKMFVSSGYNRGCTLLDLSGKEPVALWETKSLKNHFSSSVYLDGFLYGVDGNTGKGTLSCLDPASGDAKWTEDVGFGALMVANNKLIFLGEHGKLHIAEASPDGYKEHASTQLKEEGTWWTMPILCNGIIYCRNSAGALLAVDMGPAKEDGN